MTPANSLWDDESRVILTLHSQLACGNDTIQDSIVGNQGLSLMRFFNLLNTDFTQIFPAPWDQKDSRHNEHTPND